jgi:hypothetical protein
MKRTALIALAAFALAALAVPASAARSKDFKVIQNAVKQDPAAEKGKDKRRGGEARFLKVVIRDGGDGAEIKISLPVPLIELALAHTRGTRFKFDDEHGEVDLKACWRALKRSGPRAMVEIRDGGAVFRLWLE